MEAASRGERVGCLAPLRAPANGRARGPARWSTRRPNGEDLVGSGSLTGSGRRWDRSLCRFNPKFAKKSGDFPPTGIPGVGAGGQRGTPVGSSGWARRCARAPTPCVGPSAAASRCHASRLRARREASAGTGARRRGVGRIGGRSAARRGQPGGPARGPSGRRVGLARGQRGRPVGIARGPSGRPVGPSRRTSCSSCTRAPRGADRAVCRSVRRVVEAHLVLLGVRIEPSARLSVEAHLVHLGVRTSRWPVVSWAALIPTAVQSAARLFRTAATDVIASVRSSGLVRSAVRPLFSPHVARRPSRTCRGTPSNVSPRSAVRSAAPLIGLSGASRGRGVDGTARLSLMCAHRLATLLGTLSAECTRHDFDQPLATSWRGLIVAYSAESTSSPRRVYS